MKTHSQSPDSACKDTKKHGLFTFLDIVVHQYRRLYSISAFDIIRGQGHKINRWWNLILNSICTNKKPFDYGIS
ncbi:unnamed protein product [Arabis nemorensis]|uniref:Uncharacterized protein n=1 Tax=Arabis nemorensis TaxID=586526 RepID=A0A565BHI2_9BRAS|nr:unnamed protein product [Arabis nemorensis]